MPEIFVDTRGEFGLEDWSEQLRRFPQYADRAVASALKSEGYRMQQMIKLSIQRGGPDGEKWPKLSPHADPIRLSKKAAHRQQKGTGRRNRRTKWQKVVAQQGHVEVASKRLPLQKLAGATRYYYDDSIKTVTIGFLDQQKRGLGKLHASGYEIAVTSRMRKMLFAAGMPLKKGTTQLKVPGRPVVSPIFEREKANIRKNVAMKSLDNLVRYLQGKAKTE